MNWISVDERLPVNNADDMGEQLYISQEVIVFDGAAVNAAEFHAGKTIEFWSAFSKAGVTHWMPLPAPPTGEPQ